MTLRLAVAHLASSLDVPSPDRDGRWALRVCRQTREVHLALCAELPQNGQVTGEIIPLMERAKEAVGALSRGASVGIDREDLNVFLDNIGQRVSDLYNYVEKGILRISPGDPLQDPINDQVSRQ